ncbi:MAG: ParB N-terminal domain-containing protein [Solobacterium sp.]|nr:ParB N-terminal domain-containing protein [Solobacterium sp.]
MINKKVPLDEIRWENCSVSEDLVSSIRQRGVAIAVKVNETEEGYECVDGRKRLSACRTLAQEDQRFQAVPVMILNNFTKAGSAYWGNTQNRH